jgi:hypothetical protein
MAHFAEIDNNNIVTRVIVIDNKHENDGENFCKKLTNSSYRWIQTSYNNNIRYNYAGRGFEYDEDNDAFIPIKPYNSWLLNDDFKWESPIPQTDPLTIWDEDTLSWINPVD